MRRRLLVALVVVVLVVLGGGVAAAGSPPQLHTAGATSVDGTDATGVFELGGRMIRQVRYADKGTLVYGFDLVNDGRLPVRVDGLAEGMADPRLFDYVSLVDDQGAASFTIGAGDREHVRLRLRMSGCETLSARAGSFVTEISLRTSSLGWSHDGVLVSLPEEVRTGSPREAGCANATATSRPPG